MTSNVAKNSHLHRRLGHLKANKITCCVTTLSGCDYNGLIVSFDDMALVLKGQDSTHPNQLVTVMLQGLESISAL